MEKNIFIYWIGKEYSLIKILRELIYLHSNDGKNYKVHFLNDDNIKDYIENIPQKYYELLPAHKADFVRVNVICDYGGIWLDSDTIVMDNLSSLFKILEEKNGFFIKEKNIHIINGVFGSKKKTQLLLRWKEKINFILETTPIKKLHKKKFWSIIGSKILKNFINEEINLFDNYTIFNGLDNVYPIYWKFCSREFIKKPYENYKRIIRNYQPFIILVNSVYKELEKLSADEIKEKNMPINYFITKSYLNK